MKTILRVSNGIVFVISLPLLLLTFFYASETVFWNEGPATDYPLFHTPRPGFAIRMHGLLCLVSVGALLLSSAKGMMERNTLAVRRSKLDITIFFSCLACTWWDPWANGSMHHEELIARTGISIPFLWMLLLHAASMKMGCTCSMDSKKQLVNTA